MDRWRLVASSDGRVGARIDGEIDLTNGRALVDFLDNLLIEAGQRVEVDLSGVVFIDSYGLQALLNVRRLAEERGAELVLIEPSGLVRRLLGLTGCVNIFTVVSRRHEWSAEGGCRGLTRWRERTLGRTGSSAASPDSADGGSRLCAFTRRAVGQTEMMTVASRDVARPLGHGSLNTSGPSSQPR
jgi:anti-sigma B factor antagonist